MGREHAMEAEPTPFIYTLFYKNGRVRSARLILEDGYVALQPFVRLSERGEWPRCHQTKGTIIMTMDDKLSELCHGERQGIPLNVVVLVGAVLFCCVASELALAIK